MERAEALAKDLLGLTQGQHPGEVPMTQRDQHDLYLWAARILKPVHRRVGKYVWHIWRGRDGVQLHASPGPNVTDDVLRAAWERRGERRM
jgi:hypothetical protein